jgi:ketosteroid isomerase-like protein
MSQQNVEIVRTMFDQTARGDFSRWFADVTYDFVFVAGPELRDAGLRE